MFEIEVDHTHLYKGARGRVLAQCAAGGGGATLVQFADGVTTSGRLIGATLVTEPYVTRAGTAIPAKAWRLRGSGDGCHFVVDGRDVLPAQRPGQVKNDDDT